MKLFKRRLSFCADKKKQVSNADDPFANEVHIQFFIIRVPKYCTKKYARGIYTAYCLHYIIKKDTKILRYLRFNTNIVCLSIVVNRL